MSSSIVQVDSLPSFTVIVMGLLSHSHNQNNVLRISFLKRLQVQLPLSRRVLWGPREFQHGLAPLEASGVHREPYFSTDWPSILRLRL